MSLYRPSKKRVLEIKDGVVKAMTMLREKGFIVSIQWDQIQETLRMSVRHKDPDDHDSHPVVLFDEEIYKFRMGEDPEDSWFVKFDLWHRSPEDELTTYASFNPESIEEDDT